MEGVLSVTSNSVHHIASTRTVSHCPLFKCANATQSQTHQTGSIFHTDRTLTVQKLLRFFFQTPQS